MELEKAHYFFKATFLTSLSNIILLKPTNFSKQWFMENYKLVSSRAKFTRLLYLKLMLIRLINNFHVDFVISNFLSDVTHYFLTGPKVKLVVQKLKFMDKKEDTQWLKTKLKLEKVIRRFKFS